MKACAHCGAPIKYAGKAKGWVHALPLAQLRVSRRELQDILANPIPPGHHELHRQTVMHPARPRRGRPEA